MRTIIVICAFQIALAQPPVSIDLQCRYCLVWFITFLAAVAMDVHEGFKKK